MSLVPMDATGRNGSVALTRGDMRLEVDGAATIPAAVIVGVRPEHVHVWSDDPALAGPLQGRVDYVEMLGRESFVGVAAADGANFIVLVEPRSGTVRGTRWRSESSAAASTCSIPSRSGPSVPCEDHQRSRWMTSSLGRRFGCSIGRSGRSAGYPNATSPTQRRSSGMPRTRRASA
jgi:TOBE domain